MEPVGPGNVLGAILGAIANLNEPSANYFDINRAAPAEHRPLGFAVPGDAITVHPSQITDIAQIETSYGTTALSLSFTPEIAAWIAKTTAANIGNPMDLTLCGEVLTAPVIQSAIPGGTLQITGGEDIGDIGLAIPVIAGQFDCAANPLSGAEPASGTKRTGSRG